MSVFFFFKQKTAYEMRSSDWSSDVCSSDLRLRRRHHAVLRQPARWRKGRGRRRLHPQPVGGRAMIQIQYRTQRLSMRFFMLMLVLFVVQVAFGMLLAVQHIDPALLAGTLNFNIARAEHLNLGIIWILSGFIGTILFIGPLLSGRELAAPWMIKFLFYALVAVTIWNVVAQGFASKIGRAHVCTPVP